MKNKWLMVPVVVLAVFGLALAGCSTGGDDAEEPTKDSVVPAGSIELVSCGGNPDDGTVDGNKYTLVSTEANSSSVGFYWPFPTGENSDGFKLSDYDTVKVTMKILAIGNGGAGVSYIAKTTNQLGDDVEGGGIAVIGGAGAENSGEFKIGGANGFQGMIAFQYNAWNGATDPNKEAPNHQIEVTFTFQPKAAPVGDRTDFPQTVVMADNFFYGNGYQNGTDASPSPATRWNRLLNKPIAADDVYEINMEFTVSRDLEAPLAVGLVNTSSDVGYWQKLCDYQAIKFGEADDVNKPEADNGKYEPTWDGDVLKAGETYTETVTLTLARAAASPSDVGLYFITEGKGTKGTLGTGSEHAFDLVFTKLEFTKK